MHSFAVFARSVGELLKGEPDPYLAVLAREHEASKLYDAHQNSIVAELREAVSKKD